MTSSEHLTPTPADPPYPAARLVSGRIEAYFSGQIDARYGAKESAASKPDAATIEALIDVAFWASLRREEGRRSRR
jgi:hypothetical protein